MDSFFAKPANALVQADIEALVANEIGEGRTLDYKEALPGNSDSERKEFLADVSSFANASGGSIVFGIREMRSASGPTGAPEAALGLAIANPDQEVQRLESMALAGIDPRIPGLRFRVILGFPNGPVLVVRIPRSWLALHMVTYQRSNRFWSRSTSGKYLMEVTEIRNAFAATDVIGTRIRQLRDDRIARIAENETPVPLREAVRLVMHCIPFGALDGRSHVDIRDLEGRWRTLVPFGGPAPAYRINFDGLVTHDALDRPARSYAQMFRSSIIETAAAYEPRGNKLFGEHVEGAFVGEVKECLRLYREMAVDPPIAVLLTLANVAGLRIALVDEMQHFMRGRDQPIDRPTLFLPEIVFEDFETDVAKGLRPAVDALWQAAGWSGSPYFDSEGNWAHPS